MNEVSGLKPTLTPGAVVQQAGENTWRLEIPAGPKGIYRVAQLDDYGSSPRQSFAWDAPMRFSVRARASARELPGTWGLGLWNNPFGMAVLQGVEVLRLPTLPNAAWFFFASPPNNLSLRDDLPGVGAMAGIFHSPKLPAPMLLLGVPFLPLLYVPGIASLVRRMGRKVVKQDAIRLGHPAEDWHTYELEWRREGVSFAVDGRNVLETGVTPEGPLGLVIWVDNQYASLPAKGHPSFGTLENPEPAWIEIAQIEVMRLPFSANGI